MLKLSENPPMIWPECASISQFDGTWWVAHTKSRNEKALAWQLQNKSIQYFLPMTMRVTRNKNRTFRSLIPLFTSYLFFCGNENDRLEALKTNRIAGLITVNNVEAFIKDLDPIEKLIRQGAPLKAHPYVKKGQKCRIIAGPLLGTEGIVEQVPEEEKMRLILQVEILGQATSVEIDMDTIDLLDD